MPTKRNPLLDLSLVTHVDLREIHIAGRNLETDISNARRATPQEILIAGSYQTESNSRSQRRGALSLVIHVDLRLTQHLAGRKAESDTPKNTYSRCLIKRNQIPELSLVTQVDLPDGRSNLFLVRWNLGKDISKTQHATPREKLIAGADQTESNSLSQPRHPCADLREIHLAGRNLETDI